MGSHPTTFERWGIAVFVIDGGHDVVYRLIGVTVLFKEIEDVQIVFVQFKGCSDGNAFG